ncbi:unnamed protein product [Prunus armeniaca]
MTSTALVLDLGLKLPSGQPELVGPTPPRAWAAPLERNFFSFPLASGWACCWSGSDADVKSS